MNKGVTPIQNRAFEVRLAKPRFVAKKLEPINEIVQ
jgi:hypothetical protein